MTEVSPLNMDPGRLVMDGLLALLGFTLTLASVIPTDATCKSHYAEWQHVKVVTLVHFSPLAELHGRRKW